MRGSENTTADAELARVDAAATWILSRLDLLEGCHGSANGLARLPSPLRAGADKQSRAKAVWRGGRARRRGGEGLLHRRGSYHRSRVRARRSGFFAEASNAASSRGKASSGCCRRRRASVRPGAFANAARSASASAPLVAEGGSSITASPRARAGTEDRDHRFAAPDLDLLRFVRISA